MSISHPDPSGLSQHFDGKPHSVTRKVIFKHAFQVCVHTNVLHSSRHHPGWRLAAFQTANPCYPSTSSPNSGFSAQEPQTLSFQPRHFSKGPIWYQHWNGCSSQRDTHLAARSINTQSLHLAQRKIWLSQLHFKVQKNFIVKNSSATLSLSCYGSLEIAEQQKKSWKNVDNDLRGLKVHNPDMPGWDWDEGRH